MLNEIKSAALRSSSTLIEDTIGAAALAVILLGGLYLPVLA